VRRFTVDPQLEERAAALFHNLIHTGYDRNAVLVGSEESYTRHRDVAKGTAEFRAVSDLELTCGKGPMVVGVDLIHVANTKHDDKAHNWFWQQEQLMIKEAKQAFRKGAIVTASWHFGEPRSGKYDGRSGVVKVR
jgi:mannan endo-1,4-beta-mannosidase